MYNHWRSLCDSGHEDRGFIEYSVRVVCGQVDVDSSDKLFKTFLKACAEETRPGCTFARDLRLVVHVVQDQRARACERAQGLQRAHVMWSGNQVDHQDLMSILKKAKVEEEQENGVNGVLSRIMKLEAERMLRFGECSVSKPLIRIESIAKPKEVKKWTDEKVRPSYSHEHQMCIVKADICMAVATIMSETLLPLHTLLDHALRCTIPAQSPKMRALIDLSFAGTRWFVRVLPVLGKFDNPPRL